MALPKISVPTFALNIPSKNKKKTFRPFLVKEEKILLMAQQGNEQDMIDAIKQIINNCCVEDINVDSLATFDIEYLFLKLRGKSVDNIIELKFRDKEDDKVYDFQINLDEIEITINEENDPKIEITNEIGMIMKYPNIASTQKMAGIDDQEDVFNKVLISCIDTIYDEESVYPASEHTDEELIEFIEQLDSKSFKKIEKFFDTLPKLSHVLEYENELGHKRRIELNTVQDFLT